jgi:hypothetical protein
MGHHHHLVRSGRPSDQMTYQYDPSFHELVIVVLAGIVIISTAWAILRHKLRSQHEASRPIDSRHRKWYR